MQLKLLQPDFNMFPLSYYHQVKKDVFPFKYSSIAVGTIALSYHKEVKTKVYSYHHRCGKVGFLYLSFFGSFNITFLQSGLVN